MCLMLQPMSIILAKLITAMTKEGKFKDAIQDKIGATVDTTDLKKQLSVLNASLHQAETIKTRLEQQMDNLDVTDTHYDKKISDLQRRLDAQYDRIDEAYSECTDAEKKQFMQAFIERIDIFPERREDGNWIQNIKFQFPVPIIKEGKEVAQIKGISLDKEKSNEHMVSLEKLSTLETVCLLSKLQSKEHIEIEVKMDELDLTSAESKATYEEIREYIFEHTGLKVSYLYIAQVKQKYGIIERENYNKPKSENAKQPQCPPEKERAITEALKHFEMI